MSTTFVANTTNPTGNAASYTITMPTCNGGDFLVMAMARNANEAAPTLAGTASSGWTLLNGTGTQASSLTAFIWAKVAAGTVGSASSEAGTTMTATLASSPTAGRAPSIVESHRGIDTTTPVDVSISMDPHLTATASSSHTTPSVNAATAGAFGLEIVMNKTATAETGHTAPAGVTKNSQGLSGASSAPSLAMGTIDTPAASAGASMGGHTWTSVQSSQYITATLLLRPASTAAAGTASLSLTASGTATGPGAAAGTATLSLSASGTAGGRAAGTSALALTATGAAAAPAATYLDVGGPAADGFVVVAKGTSITSLSLKVSTSSSMTSPSTFSFGSADADGFYRVTATGLSPFTQYYYQLSDSAGGSFGPIAQAYTAPTPGAQTSFSVVLGACVRSSSSNGVALANATARAAHLNIFTGDQSYGSTTSTSRTVHEGQVLTQLAAVPSYAAFWRNVAKLLTLSDHDAGPDNGPSNLTDAPYQQASIDAYLHYSSYRAIADTRNPTVGRYYSVVYGRVKFIVIDVRNTDRTTVTSTGTSSDTMLGATQKAWLKAELLTGEPIKIIVGDTQLTGPDDNTGGVPVKGDWWPAYPHERDEIFATYIPTHNCGHVEYWHGDSHLIGYATAAKNSALGGVPSICAAGYDQDGGGRATSSFSAFWNNSSGAVTEYGYVTFTDNGSNIVRTFTGYDASSGTDVSRVSDSVTINLAAGSATLSLTASGAARAPAAGTATLSLTASGSAVAPAAGAATLALSATGAAAGRATGTAALSLTASGAAAAPGTATATLSLTATGTARAPAAGTASLSLSAVGAATAPAVGSASLALTATGAGVAPAGASATLALTGSGAATAPVAGTATISLSASGTAAVRATGSASLSLSASATPRAPGAGTAALSLTATGSATQPGGATGSASITLSATGTGRATVAGSASLALVAGGTPAVTAAGTASIALSGAGVAGARAQGAAALTLFAAATAQAASAGLATLALTATGTAVAVGPSTGPDLVILGVRDRNVGTFVRDDSSTRPSVRDDTTRTLVTDRSN